MDPFACHWSDVEFHFEIDLQKWSAGNIQLTISELWYMYIMSTWNTCNINNTAWKFTMNLSKKNTLLGLFPVTEFILHVHCIFLFDACKLSCCLHVHEIDTGTIKARISTPTQFQNCLKLKKKWGQHLPSSYYWYAWHYFIRYIPP